MIRDCPCGCEWREHVIINRYSVAEMDLLHAFEEKKAKAGEAVGYAVLTGRLVPPDRCESCGRKGRTSGHHEDYDKPLTVNWLCQVCHFHADQARRERDASQFFSSPARVQREAIRAIERLAS